VQIKKGHDRVVLLIPSLKIVVKFPIIRFWAVIRRTFYHVRRKQWRALWYIAKSPVNSWGSLSGNLLKGLAANWNESRFFRETKNPFLLPTHFSLLGLLNIQRYGEPCRLESVDLWCQLVELTNSDVWEDNHHFENPDNFCFYQGRLHISDYGSLRCQGVIIRHGAKIIDSFNPAYDWEEEKKKYVK
jgi:hypothetical protein